MDFIWPFFMGVSMKVYDDITDMKLSNNTLIIEFLKTFQTFAIIFSTISDFNFGVVFFIINAFAFLADKDAYLSDPYYASVISLFPLLLIYSYSTRHSENLMSILYVLCFIVFFSVEPFIIREEYSELKLFIRFITSCVVFSGLFISKIFGVSDSCLKFGVTCLGYIMVSTGFQFYMLSNNNDLSKTISLHT